MSYDLYTTDYCIVDDFMINHYDLIKVKGTISLYDDKEFVSNGKQLVHGDHSIPIYSVYNLKLNLVELKPVFFYYGPNYRLNRGKKNMYFTENGIVSYCIKYRLPSYIKIFKNRNDPVVCEKITIPVDDLSDAYQKNRSCRAHFNVRLVNQIASSHIKNKELYYVSDNFYKSLNDAVLASLEKGSSAIQII